MPRPESERFEEVADLKPDIVVSDLWQLHEALRVAKGDAVLYQVQVEAPHEKLVSRFIEWMRQEHGPDLLNVPGCLDFSVKRKDSTSLFCEYTFRSRHDLDTYYQTHAPRLRQKSQEAFGELLKFSRVEQNLVVCGRRDLRT